VPASVCLEEEALGLLSPRTRAAADRMICVSQGAKGVCKQQHSMQITTPCPSLVSIRGTASLLWSPPPKPHQVCN
jgi:hypothetical protein